MKVYFPWSASHAKTMFPSKFKKFSQTCWKHWMNRFCSRDYHDRWQGEFQPLLRQVPNEHGEVGADAASKGEEEEDEDDDGDEEEGPAEGSVCIREVRLDVAVGLEVGGLDVGGLHGPTLEVGG